MREQSCSKKCTEFANPAHLNLIPRAQNFISKPLYHVDLANNWYGFFVFITLFLISRFLELLTTICSVTSSIERYVFVCRPEMGDTWLSDSKRKRIYVAMVTILLAISSADIASHASNLKGTLFTIVTSQIQVSSFKDSLRGVFSQSIDLPLWLKKHLVFFSGQTNNKYESKLDTTLSTNFFDKFFAKNWKVIKFYD